MGYGSAARPPRPLRRLGSAIDPDTRGTTTIREQLDRHRADTSCAACHSKIDPPGFAMEAFDPIGGLRMRYRSSGQGDIPPRKGKPIGAWEYKLGPLVDAAGVLPDSRTFNGPSDLAELLCAEPEKLACAFVSHMSRYATGADIRFADRAEIRRIVAQTKGLGLWNKVIDPCIRTKPSFLS